MNLTRRTRARKFALIPHTTPARNLVSTSPREAQWMKPVGKSPDRRWELDPANKKLFNPLQGSRLAIVLHEVRDKYGEHDPHLRQLAEQALSGAGDIGGKGDVYTQIRDRLHLHAAGKAGPLELGQRGPMTAHAKRADEIARSYNWHRVGAGLQVDEAVADYINKVAKDHLKDRNEQMRATHNVFGLGSKERGQASPESRLAFMKGLQQHVRKQAVGPNSIYGLNNEDISSEKLMKSIRRLAQNEEHIHGVKGAGGLRQATPSAPVSEVKPAVPAWYPRTAGQPGISRVNPRARAGQFMRLRKMNRYSESDFSLPQEMQAKQGPEMLARGDTSPGHGLKKPDARTQQLSPTNASPVSDRALAAISRPGKRENYEPSMLGRPNAVKKAQQLTLLSSVHTKAGLKLDDEGHVKARDRAYAEADKHKAEAEKLIEQHKMNTKEIYSGDWGPREQMIKDAMKKHLEASIPRGWTHADTDTPGGVPDEEEPIKKDAYRAPAGGIAVRGTAYKGGSLIPDMKGKFMTMARARRLLNK